MQNIKNIESDKIITPEWCAKDMIDWFKPEGKILDPCKGNGVFLKFLPTNSYWCEIDYGKDFFSWNKQVDWVIGNPPYSLFGKWLKHSYEISENIVYLIPSFKLNPLSVYRTIYSNGLIKHIRMYDVGNKKINWARSRPIFAVHFLRDYFKETSWSLYNDPA